MARCKACDKSIPFSKEFCEECSDVIYYYNYDLHVEEDEYGDEFPTDEEDLE